MRLPARAARATLVASLVARVGAAQSPAPETIPGLGTLTFPTSTRSTAAQTSFVRGVLLLHVFEYGDAAASFRKAERLDPAFAMAYWGEAMTYTHPVWNQQDLESARAALTKLGTSAEMREGRGGTERERAYLRAVDVLYGDGPKARRDTLYGDAMERVLRANPADDEARAFYALALLGLSQGVRTVPTYLRAAAIAESVYTRNPNHPGAAHYWIHGMDDPDHAAGALTAARALAVIAPDAGHSQHMTSHIFLALGMWDDVVAANENALRVVNAMRKSRGRGPDVCGHYPSWLAYGYLEQGRRTAARALLHACWEDAVGSAPVSATNLDPDNSKHASLVAMWARYELDARDWPAELMVWTMDPGPEPATRLNYNFIPAYMAAQRGDLDAASAALAAFDSAARALDAALPASAAADPKTIEYAKRERALRLELLGVIAIKRGALDSGLALLARATVVEDSTAAAFGPPFVDEPSYEVLGDELLAAGHSREALAAFHAALARAPRRTSALLGLARAATALGETAAAAQAYHELVVIWHAADSGNPRVDEARRRAGAMR